MVRINKLALLALSASALAATTHNYRRSVDILAEPEVFDRAAAVFDLETRQKDAPDSPEVQKLKDERKAISPELDQARQDKQAAKKAAEAAIPQDLKAKEDQARAALQAARKAAKDAIPQDLKTKQTDTKAAFRAAAQAAEAAIPQDLKTKEEEASKKFQAVRQGLPEDKKAQLRDNGKAIAAAKKQASPSGAPAAAAPPAAAPAPPAA